MNEQFKELEDLMEKILTLSELAAPEDYEEHENPLVRNLMSEFFGMKNHQAIWIQNLIEKVICEHLAIPTNKFFADIVFIDSITKIKALKLILKLICGSEYYITKTIKEDLEKLTFTNMLEKAIQPANPKLN